MKSLLLLLSCLSLRAYDVALTWDISTNSPVPLAGYRLFIGTNSAIYYGNATIAGTTNNAVTVTNLVPGQAYYFVITSIATNGLLSLPSDELRVVIPLSPSGFRIKLSLQQSAMPDGPWTDETNWIADVQPVDTKRFFRSRMDWIAVQ